MDVSTGITELAMDLLVDQVNEVRNFLNYGRILKGYDKLVQVRNGCPHGKLIFASLNKPNNVFNGYLSELNEHCSNMRDSDWWRFELEEDSHKNQIKKTTNVDARRRLVSEGFSRFSSKRRAQLNVRKNEDIRIGDEIIDKIIRAMNL